MIGDGLMILVYAIAAFTMIGTALWTLFFFGGLLVILVDKIRGDL